MESMNNAFVKEFEVHYYEINKYQEATPVSMLNYMEETAIAHSESVGYGLDGLRAIGCGWVLYKWNVKIDKYPVWGEKIYVETWPSNFEKFYATREFLVKDEKGQIIVKASSRWIFLNIERKRPVRIPVEISNAYLINPINVIEGFSEESAEIKDMVGRKEFTVRKSDIDTNNHVNNTKYLEWMLEGIENSIDNDYFLSSIEIEYKKETNYGDTIYVYNNGGKSDSIYYEFKHIVTNSVNNNAMAAAKTTWTMRRAND